ncbi:S1 RNA-binding domain-containing protein 1-like isoform X2 [Asterias rubens]|uniref:S1 RNA-binding domain-containing protein 1-like isoform X2 n=1 Tax=Asterias rubens TaxID=7604 RepID=UPI001455BF4C|nr:S1 RNA-binding domain-containing protein 1-like isoform X2 [Asterias rubens]
MRNCPSRNLTGNHLSILHVLRKMDNTQKDGASTSAAKMDASSGLMMNWNIVDLLSQSVYEKYWAVRNVVDLVEEGCSVPFIARYRKERTNNMEADKIREVVSKLEELKSVQIKATTAVKQIEKSGKMTDRLLNAFKNAETIEEVKVLFVPYKTGAKTTLAERARKLGLDPAAESLLRWPAKFQLTHFVDSGVKGRSSVAEVAKGIEHILTDIIAKSSTVVNKLRQLVKQNPPPMIQTSQRAITEENQGASDTYVLYYDFSTSVRSIKPHQVMAINRAEVLKVLNVKLCIPDSTVTKLKTFCHSQWMPKTRCPELVTKLIQSSISEACSKRLLPMIIREIRSNLTKTAEKASVDVFALNLRRLLLTPPVRGKVVMGLDPGYRNGVKMAITSATGQILETDVAMLHGSHGRRETQKIVEMAKRHGCETIALGNGTACRETEGILSNLINDKAFGNLKVMYCIVNEDGASIYSVSPDAKKEMPDLDPNHRSAVSIARRLQDPLVELVKIDPKHLGIGMYQHDVHDKFLKEALDGVVEECVSFVGVDLNVCSESLLRKIAGLNVARAKKIIEYREKNGFFVNREQLLDIKGLGPKSYQQCAGFVRVSPESTGHDIQAPVVDLTAEDNEPIKPGSKRKATSSGKSKAKKKKKTEFIQNPLDMTWIHPESYNITTEVLSRAEASASDIGKPLMKTKLQRLLQSTGMRRLAEEFEVGEPTMQLIIDGLQQPVDRDIREAYDKPLFKKNLQSISDLKRGDVLTGRVTNMTHFGAFVDIGVQNNGLIHNSNIRPNFLKKGQPLGPGDKVEVKILQIQTAGRKTKIGLELCKPVM